VTLQKWDFELTVAGDGAEAWEVLSGADAPPVAILDWMMPYLDGVEVCRRARQLSVTCPTYIILLTARGNKEDVVAGLDAGADDYLTKPFDKAELRSRVQVGVRFAKLQVKLAERIRELEEAVSQVRQLQGILPICSYCKKIRDDRNYWQKVENYISDHSEAQFSHSICPGCYAEVVEPLMESRKRQSGGAE
jgi:DNA-binding response OmpR family regulator